MPDHARNAHRSATEPGKRNEPFSERFASAWKDPTPEKLGALLAENVVLKQPHLRPIRGKAAAIEEFRRLFAWLPGTWSEVIRWQEDAQVAMIEHVLHFPMGARDVRLPAIDRFRLEQGLAVERVVYFDQVKLMRAVLGSPSTWAGYLRYRAGQRASDA